MSYFPLHKNRLRQTPHLNRLYLSYNEHASKMWLQLSCHGVVLETNEIYNLYGTLEDILVRDDFLIIKDD